MNIQIQGTAAEYMFVNYDLVYALFVYIFHILALLYHFKSKCQSIILIFNNILIIFFILLIFSGIKPVLMMMCYFLTLICLGDDRAINDIGVWDTPGTNEKCVK